MLSEPKSVLIAWLIWSRPRAPDRVGRVRSGKRIPCLEIMKRSVGTQDALVRNDLAQLASTIEASVKIRLFAWQR
jgi:hypothetical protein